MFKLDYPFYRILLSLIGGIVISSFSPLPLDVVLLVGIILVLLFLSSFLIKRHSKISRMIFGMSALGIFGIIGTGTYLLSVTPYSSNDHVAYADLDSKYIQVFELTIDQQIKSNRFNNRYYARVDGVDGMPVTGNILLYLDKEEIKEFDVGTTMVVAGHLSEPPSARNPSDFDYKSYLKSIDVHAQMYVKKPQVLSIHENKHDLNIFLELRGKILELLSESPLEDNARSLVEALLIGQRQNVDPELTDSFRDAGVIHILALSGMHVGIILLILRLVTRPIRRLPQGIFIQTVFILVLLWSFALLTGMSASITRAVTMFSFVAVGMNLNKKVSTFHSLTLSAFFLLLYDPRLLFQVGFQLSYIAVISIVLIQPILAGLWSSTRQPTQKLHLILRNYLWNILTVTCAAQIGIAPISIYYFHQFPGLFLLGNLLLLPLLPILLGVFIILLCFLLAGFEKAVEMLSIVLNPAVDWLVQRIQWIANQDTFILREVYIEPLELVLIYAFILFTVMFFRPHFKTSRRQLNHHRKTQWGAHLAISCLIVLFGFKTLKLIVNDEDHFYVYHTSRSSAIGISNATNANLFTQLSTVNDSVYLSRLSGIAHLRNRDLAIKPIGNLITFNNISLMTVDSTAVYSNSEKLPVVLLTNSPKLNPERLIREVNPQAIICDGSNYLSYVELWQTACAENDIPFYNTYEEGAVNLLSL